MTMISCPKCKLLHEMSKTSAGVRNAVCDACRGISHNKKSRKPSARVKKRSAAKQPKPSKKAKTKNRKKRR